MPKLLSLVIDPDPESRNRVRAALLDFKAFAEPDYAITLEDSQRKIALGARYDIVFISQRFSDEEVTSFVQRSKATHFGEDVTYIMILNTNVHSDAAIRLKYALGVDAFLLAPYSSEQLKEVVEFSFQTQQERAEIRQQIALSLVIIDLIDQVNLIAFLQLHGFSTTRSMKRLVELCRPLQHAPEHVLKIYFSLLEKLFSAAPFPSHFSAKAYHSGITNRVREKMERRIIQELQELRMTESSPLKELKDLVLAKQSRSKVRVISK